MNEESWKLAENFIPSSYVRQAADASRSRENTIRQLLQHKKIPENGWDDLTIELMLQQLSSMDSNNFPSNCGIGEREGRFASELVARRHYRFGHGIGRSGDLTEPQPKAAGSSLMYCITNLMLKDLMKVMGIESPIECLLVPVATGMALVLSMLTLSSLRPTAKYVLWSRIDQKACFKSIITAGLVPIIIDTVTSGDQLVTNTLLIEEKLKEIGCDNVVCVMSTTSCFAPRACDDVEIIGTLCKKYNVPHLINNAYGLQNKYIMRRIQKSCSQGRVDVFVQSTDKNLMVPVGGAILCSFNKDLLQNIAKMYPGRASSTPVIDSFITLLSLGKNGYRSLVFDQVTMHNYLLQQLTTLAQCFGERILQTPNNPISIGMTLCKVPCQHLTKLGSMLFWRSVSGTRVITTLENKTIGIYNFTAWGSHCNNFSVPYLTAAASLGMKKSDVDTFIKRLKKVLQQLTGGNTETSLPQSTIMPDLC